MKKILCSLLLALAIASTFSACTEENVAPKTNSGIVGGGSQDPKGPL